MGENMENMKDIKRNQDSMFRKMSNDIDNFDSEVKSTYDKYGVEGFADKINAWRNQRVKIAVTGSSGCGKSSFINRVRGLTPKDESVLDESGKEVPNPEYAAVGVTETTMAPHEFPFPGNDKITIWDLPGANTVNFPTSRYSEEMKFADYDAFIILTKDRFTETDKEIASQIKELSKPFFFARTQMDTTLKNEAEDRGKKFNKEETMEKIRVKCREALGDPGQDIYLISKKEKVEVEAGNLKIEIEFRDNRLLKHAWVAAASFAGGAIPVPGISIAIDIPLLVKEASLQRKVLMIDDEDMARNAQNADVNQETYMKKVSEAIASQGAGVFLSTSAKLTAVITAQLAVSEGFAEGMKFVPVVGQILGAIVGAGVSGTMSYVTLNKMLNAHKVISEKSLEVMSNMAAKGAVLQRAVSSIN